MPEPTKSERIEFNRGIEAAIEEIERIAASRDDKVQKMLRFVVERIRKLKIPLEDRRE